MPLPSGTSGAVPVTNSNRDMRAQYTGDVTGHDLTLDVRRYYGRILPFYEKEQKSIARNHLGFWRSLARDWRPRRILDIGAGLGRITSALARHAPTIGTDISVEMLRRAAHHLPPRSRAHFVAADMRRVALAGPFDLIIASSDPFCHLTSAIDRRRALRAVASQLSEQGRFVLEGLYRRREIYEPPPRRIRHAGGLLWISERWRPVGSRQRWQARYRYLDHRSTGEESEVEASFVARAWDPTDIRALFASCGLSVEKLWGDFDRRPFRGGAKRLIAVAAHRQRRRRAARPAQGRPGAKWSL